MTSSINEVIDFSISSSKAAFFSIDSNNVLELLRLFNRVSSNFAICAISILSKKPFTPA